ncbi:glycosidase [Sanguibacter keddieii DSM 10542]|uniref:Glycosidase n=1 Tax=Sanguibacter keddieii (strain ATCC 51767 / DSM 10542 / NCFB 3025 / ST-74) TaxID=446469 RepID=D1BJV8_SANKS|nr:alpha-amylase family protein [Sanguibacter keddieii]ACZ22367.1 glycosidase [Sanguibacter keddieii DSM 10542]
MTGSDGSPPGIAAGSAPGSAPGTPAWVEHAIFWHVYPLGAVGAEQTADEAGLEVRHRLPDLEPWLDHAVVLGASGILLGPVFASSTHGYDTVDHLRVDPRLGDEADLVALVDAAHRRGLRVVLDGVFNHVGQAFPRFIDAFAAGPGSPAAGWFRLHWPDDGGPPSHDDFEGHSALVALEHSNPEVAAYVTEVMTYWGDRGVDGWRLDAAYAVPPSFWAPVLAEVRRRHPETYVLGEVIHGDYAAVVAESGMDSVTQYELWKAVWSSLNDRNAYELAHALGRHDGFVETFAPATFVGNHDTTRIASRLDDPRHLAHALVVLFTVGGTPTVYAGDELGLLGVKEDRAGGDDAVRPRLPSAPPGADGLDASPAFALHRRLVGLRRRHPWLHRARTEVRVISDTVMTYVSRAGDDEVVVALSTDDDPVEIDLGAGAEWLEGAGHLLPGGSVVRLDPHGWACLGRSADR